jgi:hypothetical protein
MNKRLLVLALALAGLPVATLAQQAPPDAPGPVIMGAGQISGQQREAMRGFMEQADKIRQQTRSQMLSALTPGHRQLLSKLAGELATSANPDPRAAAKQLDDALSSGEKQAIVSAQESFRSQMQALQEKMQSQMGPRPAEDPGMLLLGHGPMMATGFAVRTFGPGPH